MLVGMLVLLVVAEVMKAFTIVSTVSAILMIFTWSTILASYFAYHKKASELYAKSAYARRRPNRRVLTGFYRLRSLPAGLES